MTDLITFIIILVILTIFFQWYMEHDTEENFSSHRNVEVTNDDKDINLTVNTDNGGYYPYLSPYFAPWYMATRRWNRYYPYYPYYYQPYYYWF